MWKILPGKGLVDMMDIQKQVIDIIDHEFRNLLDLNKKLELSIIEIRLTC